MNFLATQTHSENGVRRWTGKRDSRRFAEARRRPRRWIRSFAAPRPHRESSGSVDQLEPINSTTLLDDPKEIAPSTKKVAPHCLSEWSPDAMLLFVSGRALVNRLGHRRHVLFPHSPGSKLRAASTLS